MKELFEAEPPKPVRKTRYQMHKAIDPDYYGFRDEEDGVLEKLEADAERIMRMQVRPCCSLQPCTPTQLAAYLNSICSIQHLWQHMHGEHMLTT